MPRGKANKRYTAELKKQIIETMMEEKLSYRETAQRFEISDHKLVAKWERIYLTEGLEGFEVERRGRGSKGRPAKQLPKAVEESIGAIAFNFCHSMIYVAIGLFIYFSAEKKGLKQIKAQKH